MSMTVLRTIEGMSIYVDVEISPATQTKPVVILVSDATRPKGSSVRIASRMESETWSAILSGWPSVTDSEVYSHRRVIVAPWKLGARSSQHARPVAADITARCGLSTHSTPGP